MDKKTGKSFGIYRFDYAIVVLIIKSIFMAIGRAQP